MLQVEVGRILISLGDGQQFSFAVELAQESKADCGARATSLDLAVSNLRLWSIIAANAVRQNHCRMSGQIGHHKLWAECWGDDHVYLLEDFDHGVHRHHAGAVSLNVLDRRDETCAAESVRPIVFGLARE